MPFVSTGHLWMVLIVLVVVLIIWGPGKLPEVGSGLGRAIREFKKASSEARDHVVGATQAETTAAPPVATPPPALAPSGDEGRPAAPAREEQKVAG